MGRIQEASRGINVLDSHPTDVNDLVLHVRRPRPQDLKGPDVPVKVFENRRTANLGDNEEQ